MLPNQQAEAITQWVMAVAIDGLGFGSWFLARRGWQERSEKRAQFLYRTNPNAICLAERAVYCASFGNPRLGAAHSW
jgi:hypothetical protein